MASSAALSRSLPEGGHKLVLCFGKHDTPTNATHGQICEGHYTQIRTGLTRMVADIHWAYHEGLFPESAPQDHNTVRTKRIDAPSPARDDVVLLLDPRTVPNGLQQPIPTIVARWVLLIARERKFAIPAGTLRGVKMMLRNLEWLADDERIVDAITDVDLCARALHHAREGSPSPVASCPIVYPLTDNPGDEPLLDGVDAECGGPIFPVPDRGLVVKCARCGELWQGSDELHKLRMLLDA